MIRISLCMIVKNEEQVLKRCLDSIVDLMDEVIIVDTGSTDKTKEIAAQYTDMIYDFKWIDDFSAARNFAFSKATCEYIYTADADEVVSDENREKFLILKKNLLPEIDIVQMLYGNQLAFESVYNFDEELRPKLFKRKREFIWEGSIHEAVRLEPIIYDSDIVITHLPQSSHVKRDLNNFAKQIAKGVYLPKRLHNMYARELMMAGDKEDFEAALPFFEQSAADVERSADEVKEACCVAAKGARLIGDVVKFFKYTTKVIASEGCSEVCCELGIFYEDLKDYDEAVIWYYNAAYETEPILCLSSKTKDALVGLARCYDALDMPMQALEYRKAMEEMN